MMDILLPGQQWNSIMQNLPNDEIDQSDTRF